MTTIEELGIRELVFTPNILDEDSAIARVVGAARDVVVDGCRDNVSHALIHAMAAGNIMGLARLYAAEPNDDILRRIAKWSIVALLTEQRR